MSRAPRPDGTSPTTGPVVLLALALVIFLGWQVWAGIRQYKSASQIWNQQEAMAQQAAETKRNFQAMMIEFIELAENNDEARRIIRKYNVTFNPNKAPAPAPVPKDESAVQEP